MSLEVFLNRILRPEIGIGCRLRGGHGMRNSPSALVGMQGSYNRLDGTKNGLLLF